VRDKKFQVIPTCKDRHCDAPHMRHHALIAAQMRNIDRTAVTGHSLFLKRNCDFNIPEL